MIRIVRWLASKLPPPRVIFDRLGKSPYLSRYYLLGKPWMPDGSHPFARDGGPRDGIVWPIGRWGLYLHRFHRGDEDTELHNHPWRWAVSFVLVGGYVEHRRAANKSIVKREVKPGRINVIRQNDFHRVELHRGEAWSLFLAGPKVAGWGFWRESTGEFIPWREFINELRDPGAFGRDIDAGSRAK